MGVIVQPIHSTNERKEKHREINKNVPRRMDTDAGAGVHGPTNESKEYNEKLKQNCPGGGDLDPVP